MQKKSLEMYFRASRRVSYNIQFKPYETSKIELLVTKIANNWKEFDC